MRPISSIGSSLDPLLRPGSVAVIGAGRDPAKWGYKVLRNILGNPYKGRVYPVNPSTRDIEGLECHAGVGDVPGEVDLAVVIVPSSAVLRVVDECGAKRVKALCVITAGFGETGPEGAALEARLREKAASHGMRMLGPNTMGLINTDIGLNASIVPKMPPKGGISFITQSGALGLSLVDWAIGAHLGMHCVVSTGNKADVCEADLLAHFERDADTRTVCMYIEGLRDGRRFMEEAKKTRKPKLAIKAGASESGARAAASHTGSLAGSDAVYDAAFRQCGVVRVEGVGEMFDAAMALSTQPPARGNRVAILSNGGGAAIMASDACERRGLTVPELRRHTKAGIARLLPAFASVKNPIDTAARSDYDIVREALRALIDDKGIDCVMVIYAHGGFTSPEEPARAVIDALGDRYPKPVVACWMGGREVGDVARLFRRSGVPCYPTPERAAEALSTLIRHHELAAGGTPG
jgi:acetyl coenzyme A synthetase (ADP forming)-like protein